MKTTTKLFQVKYRSGNKEFIIDDDELDIKFMKDVFQKTILEIKHIATLNSGDPCRLLDLREWRKRLPRGTPSPSNSALVTEYKGNGE